MAGKTRIALLLLLLITVVPSRGAKDEVVRRYEADIEKAIAERAGCGIVDSAYPLSYKYLHRQLFGICAEQHATKLWWHR